MFLAAESLIGPNERQLGTTLTGAGSLRTRVRNAYATRQPYAVRARGRGERREITQRGALDLPKEVCYSISGRRISSVDLLSRQAIRGGGCTQQAIRPRFKILIRGVPARSVWGKPTSFGWKTVGRSGKERCCPSKKCKRSPPPLHRCHRLQSWRESASASHRSLMEAQPKKRLYAGW